MIVRQRVSQLTFGGGAPGDNTPGNGTSNGVGVAMNSVSVLKPRTVGSRAVDRQSHERGDGEPAGRPISMLSFLEAENIRLRQAVVELSRDTKALRQALRKNDGP
jgi:hypothetical protein